MPWQELSVESEALRGNPLGDPAVRPLWVWTPGEQQRPLPALYLLHGMTGQGRTSLDPNNPSSLYFNTTAFSVPGQFAFGTSSQYNSKFRQPPVLGDNIALIKQVYMWPKGDGSLLRLQLSATAFNAFNRTNFAVNGIVGNPNFGRATSPQDGPRIITMALRLRF